MEVWRVREIKGLGGFLKNEGLLVFLNLNVCAFRNVGMCQ